MSSSNMKCAETIVRLIQKAAPTKWKRREKEPHELLPESTSSVNILRDHARFQRAASLNHRSKNARCVVKAAPRTWQKNTINFVFVFQGLQTEPSGTSANVRTCQRIAKQGFGQLLAFEISLGRKHLLE